MLKCRDRFAGALEYFFFSFLCVFVLVCVRACVRARECVFAREGLVMSSCARSFVSVFAQYSFIHLLFFLPTTC